MGKHHLLKFNDIPKGIVDKIVAKKWFKTL